MLYLVQHAKSKSRDQDPLRSLSEKGWEDIKKISKYAKEMLDIKVEQIIHSGKLRAKQTAEVLAEHLKPVKGVREEPNLAPLSDPTYWKNLLESEESDIMLVGHLPNLSKLASLLLGIGAREVITFRKGGILCLKRNIDVNWRIQWMIIPEIIA